MKPIVPFEPVRSQTVPSGDNWLHQIKWDGIRLLTYAVDGETRLFNRKLRERTMLYPELTDPTTYFHGSSFVLDGELIALDEQGKPSFHEVMRRDGIRRPERVEQARRAVPVAYMVFDIVFLDGQWLDRTPLAERLLLLEERLIPSTLVQLVPSHPDGAALLAAMKAEGMEGIICKLKESPYRIGEKHSSWLKVKNYGDVIAVIGGYTMQGGGINAVLLGLFDREDRFVFIGHVGSGKLNREEWRLLSDKLLQCTATDSPFAAAHPDMRPETKWTVPHICVKVQYSEWRYLEGRSLRQPTIQGIVEADPRGCKFEEG